MRSEYIAAMILGICLLVAAIINARSTLEGKKHTREVADKICINWAKLFDYTVKQHEDQIASMDYIIETKNEVIAEKDKRIEELEQQIARNEALMELVNVTESIRGKLDGAGKTETHTM